MIILIKKIFIYTLLANLIFITKVCASTNESIRDVDLFLETTPLADVLNDDYKFTINTKDFNKVKQSLWNKFRDEAHQLTSRKAEHDQNQLKFGDKVMRYASSLKSSTNTSKALYIALHGGGGAPSRVNDSQWEHMKIYYRDSVKNGYYVATRGVTDTWNLHFVDESYPLYDKLIENMVVYEGVDPNMVYLTGFSAGGDGVYQITPRMNDRFAATNMSAGHHNWIRFDNLYNTPMLIQMGEYDGAYKRNTVAAENYLQLNDLQKKYNGGFAHDLFLHLGGSHNSWNDNDANERLYSVISNPKAWLDSKDRSSHKVNSNAITWVSKYKRNPLPKKIVWDIATNAKLRKSSMGAEWLKYSGINVKLSNPVDLNYWLSVSSNRNKTDNEVHKIVANIDSRSNAINIEEVFGVDSFTIYLHPDLLDLNNNIFVNIAGQSLTYKVDVYSTNTMLLTMLERSDYNWSFPAKVTLKYNTSNNNWEI